AGLRPAGCSRKARRLSNPASGALSSTALPPWNRVNGLVPRRNRRATVGRVLLLALTTIVLRVGALAAFGATTRTTAATTLVFDNSFTIKTSDPQRAFDPTASIIDRAIFDTLFTYKGGDLSNPIPLLVQSWKATNGAKTFTFQLKKNVHFADG